VQEFGSIPFLPEGHLHPSRVLTPVAPSVSVPKGQVSHAPLELAILYKFARQLMQVPLSKVLPGEQTHCESEVAPLTPFVSVPEGQFVHVSRPVTLLYVLAEQAVHPPAWCAKIWGGGECERESVSESVIVL
jgi:hypothetical protein